MSLFYLEDNLPLIAIIRGVTPQECLDVARVLIEEGFTMIEVPLNSPDAINSIELLVKEYGDRYLIGAGTVTTEFQVRQVIATGAKLVVTPNCEERVIKLASDAGCAVFPGIVTPTEAFKALASGATGLKFFPVSLVGIEGIKALMSVLPAETLLFPVGGIEPTEESMSPYLELGVNGFGLGSALYKPGMSLTQIREQASKFVSVYRRLLDKN